MRILHIANLSTNKFSGIRNVVPEHVREQSKLAEVYYIDINNNRLEGFKNQVFYVKGKKIDSLFPILSLMDIVLFHGVYFYEYILISKTLKRYDIPYVVIPHGSLTLLSQQVKFLKKKIANLFFFKKFIMNARAIQYLSSGEQISTIYPQKKSFIGSNGIHIPETVLMHKNQNHLVLSYIGRLDVYYKGIDIMLASVSQIRDFLLQNKVLINLYGPKLGDYDRIIELIRLYKVSDIIYVHGPIYGKEKVDVLLSTDIFIQASRSEGLPMGIIETLSYGIPCIVTRGTNMGHYIQEYNAGWVCDTCVEALSQCIKQAIRERTGILIKSQNALNLAKSIFQWRRVAQQTINNYKILIK